jgi:hypothetical protein
MMGGIMRELLLREIANEYLVPFFSGAELLEASEPSSSRDHLVSWKTPQELAFKAERADTYRLILYRRQPFAMKGDTIVPEMDILSAFVSVVGSIAPHLEGPLKHDLLGTFQRRVVARSLRGSHRERVLLDGIDQLARWANRLYEGAAVSAAIGYLGKAQPDGALTFAEMAGHDFSHVISNGHDTLIELDFNGRLIGHQSLPSGSNASFAPLRQASIAEWTTEGDSRVAMTLNRLGEILIYRGQQLLFARRSGRWHFLTHQPIIKQMSPPRNLEVRRAIYETCLDASFARSGACFGVVSQQKRGKTAYVSESDLLNGGRPSTKAQAAKKLIGDLPFQSLDRRLRQELVSIDGATVLSHTGEILAVGAILRIPSGSASGGRRAAARQLSNLGLGIKVSQDGGVEAFRNGGDDPSFRVM